MDKTAEGYLPIIMLQVLHAVYPHYAEKQRTACGNSRMPMNCGHKLSNCFQKSYSVSLIGLQLMLQLRVKLQIWQLRQHL
ncbi:uncharacterized protein LOC134183371 isoform X2 [Corticium candelabrum]|nr:uncharacterized protein LOC134183371 isoform X2 [Corticium candelabrum]XP_062506865.1 uncharacterized protein LOC134183371 isoform X2 [Corticium candelabrum]